MRKKDQINLESKIKTVRFIGETFASTKLGLRKMLENVHGKMFSIPTSVFFGRQITPDHFTFFLPEIDSSIVSACREASFIN